MKQKRLKKQLGERYFFEQRLSAAVVANLLETLDGSNHFLIAASLAVGAVKLEAVVYWNNGKYSLGYDLLVKDTPLSPDWICYENLPDPVRYNAWNLEREMFLVLDRGGGTVWSQLYGVPFPRAGWQQSEAKISAQVRD